MPSRADHETSVSWWPAEAALRDKWSPTRTPFYASYTHSSYWCVRFPKEMHPRCAYGRWGKELFGFQFFRGPPKSACFHCSVPILFLTSSFNGLWDYIESLATGRVRRHKISEGSIPLNMASCRIQSTSNLEGLELGPQDFHMTDFRNTAETLSLWNSPSLFWLVKARFLHIVCYQVKIWFLILTLHPRGFVHLHQSLVSSDDTWPRRKTKGTGFLAQWEEG